MKREPLILWGAAGQAKVLREFAPTLGYDVVAVFDNNPAVLSPFSDVRIYHGWNGFLEWRASFTGDCSFLAAIGGLRGNPRIVVHEQLVGAGLRPATFIHPTAWVAKDAEVGAGSQVLAGAAVATEAVLGRGCIINTRASVDHESVLGDGVHVAPGATLCGNVTVGAGTFIGAGAVVIHNVTVGAGCVVGAGAVVLRDVPPGVTVAGNPAKLLGRDQPA